MNGNAVSGGRSYKSREERRREIIAATLAILAERGMHAWTTSALADRVGVSEAAIFRHFEDKDEILTEALRHQARELRSRIQGYRGDGTPWERAEGLVRHLLAYLEETEGGPIVILLGHASRIRPEMREEIDRTRRLLRAELGQLVGEALERSGRTGELDPEAVADLTHAAALTSALRWAMLGERAGDLQEVADPMLEVIRKSLHVEAGDDPGQGTVEG